ncbi:MAG: S8 family serine peptidase [Deltaproteobacteria bacterium]|nr:S8 family serine peptidase [Deltaproteobacteria bacterium]
MIVSIGVGALTTDGQPWENSNHGSFVTLYAPGVATFPLGNQGESGTYAGTSISTAHVASTVSAFLTANPQATREQIYNSLGISP